MEDLNKLMEVAKTLSSADLSVVLQCAAMRANRSTFVEHAYAWAARCLPSCGVRLTTDINGKSVEFRLHLDIGRLNNMLLKASTNQSQRSADGPVEVGIISGLPVTTRRLC